MARKFVLKRLTASDLTFFKWHFQNRPAGNQKAINLDSRVLVGALFPQLGKSSVLPHPKIVLELVLQGPGMAPAMTLVRKILKQQKNWRLNGEFIENPIEDPDRYNGLVPDDYGVFEFNGDGIPTQVRLHLIAQNTAEDVALHQAIRDKYGSASTWTVEEDELASLLQGASLASDHPLMEWIESAMVEDAGRGGAQGLKVINRRRGGRGMSPEELLRARDAAQTIGVEGEVLVSEYLDSEQEAGRVVSFEWTASINAVAPYDFEVVETNGTCRFIDAKSTSGQFENPLHMSAGEIEFAVQSINEYGICRVFGVGRGTARMRVARDIRKDLLPVIQKIREMPAGVSVDSVSIDPALFSFDSAVIVPRANIEEEVLLEPDH